MHLIGRYEQLRSYNPLSGIGPSFILDNKREKLTPYQHDRWMCERGIWLPYVRGGVNLGLDFTTGKMSIGQPDSSTSNLSPTTLALDSAYTAGSAGDAHGTRFIAHRDLTLANFYFYIASFTGTAANVNDIDIELRAASSTITKPDMTGGGLLESKSYDPGATTGWQKVTGFTTTLTAGTVYWIVIADADGGAVDFATINQGSNCSTFGTFTGYGNHYSLSSTNGFSTGAVGQRTALTVLDFNDGFPQGLPFSTNTATSSSTVQRGFRFATGFSNNVKIRGMMPRTANVAYSTAQVWASSNGPTGTPDAETSFNILNTSSQVVACMFGSQVTLTNSIPYRIVFSFGSTVALNTFDIGTGEDSVLRSALPGGGGWYWTEESGGAWVDTQGSFPREHILLAEISEEPVTTTFFRTHPVLPTERTLPR